MATSQHLINIDNHSTEYLLSLLQSAKKIYNQGYHLYQQKHDLEKITVINAFFESSTRTRVSFEIAAKRLGATVINLPVEQSALIKGESILDTINTLSAMNCQLFVIRHPENELLEHLQHEIDHPVSLINAGTGTHAHPTQALLDMLTIINHYPDFSNCKIAIIGDIKHSRVVSSQLALFAKLGISNIRLIAPKSWQPTTNNNQISMTEDLESGIEDCDVVITLRVQKERIMASDQMDLSWYRQHFQLSSARLSRAKPGAIVLHPGPINRDVEIASTVADCPQSCIQEQVACGIAVRMAVLSNMAKTVL